MIPAESPTELDLANARRRLGDDATPDGAAGATVGLLFRALARGWGAVVEAWQRPLSETESEAPIIEMIDERLGGRRAR